jgi:hypothetical protein
MQDEAMLPLERLTIKLVKRGITEVTGEPIRESLLAQMSMSKETKSATEPTSLTTAYIGYRLGQKARIRARHLEV